MSNMKELPANERPYEKCMIFGPKALTDSELLAVILRNGSQGESSLDLARRLLHNENQLYQGLLSLHHLSFEQLIGIPGIGPVKAVMLQCMVELSSRIAAMSAKEKLTFCDPESIADYYMERFRHCEQEHLLCLMLDTRLGLIKEQPISYGTVSETLISPRELFIEALKCNAVNLVLLHNHPTGDPTPSEADQMITQKIFDLGEMLNIHLTDHIIIGDLNYFSMKQCQLF